MLILKQACQIANNKIVFVSNGDQELTKVSSKVGPTKPVS